MHPIITLLERQRRGSRSRVFALIADRRRTLRRIIVDYIVRHQRTRAPDTCAAVFTASAVDRKHFARIPHVKFFSPRRPDNIRGQTFQQIIIDSADLYLPSVPYYRGPFRFLPAACYPALPDKGAIMIILGDPSRPGHNHFRHYWHQVAHLQPFLLLDPLILAQESLRRHAHLVPPNSSLAPPHSSLVPHHSDLVPHHSDLVPHTSPPWVSAPRLRA